MWNETNANKQKYTVRLSEKGHKMCINQIHLIQPTNTVKIQFNHFSALLYFTNLLITPLRTALQKNSTPVLPVKAWYFQ